MMKNILKFFSYVLCAAVVLCAMGLFMLNEDVTYNEMNIPEGEDLYTLAEKYRGTLSISEWIAIVKRENDMYGTYVYEGQTLIIPVHKDLPSVEDDSIKLARNTQ